MKHMLKYIFSLLFFSQCVVGFAQADTTKVTYPKTYGLRIGTDLNKIARNFYEDKYKGFEIVGDYRISEKLYIAAEVGLEDKYTKEDRLTFTTSGQYLKLGVDYNVYQNWLDMQNMIYVGGRVGYARFKQDLGDYTLRDLNHYFPEETYSGRTYDGLNAVWLEFVAGTKVEVFSNLYLGVSARVNYKFSDTKPDNFENLHIPGFNKKYSGNFGVGFNYTLSYVIPFKKK